MAFLHICRNIYRDTCEQTRGDGIIIRKKKNRTDTERGGRGDKGQPIFRTSCDHNFKRKLGISA